MKSYYEVRPILAKSHPAEQRRSNAAAPWERRRPRRQKYKYRVFITNMDGAIDKLVFLFIAAKIWRHSGRIGVNFSDHKFSDH